MATSITHTESFTAQMMYYFWTLIGAFLAAVALDIFFIPNNLFDGGTVGIAMIISKFLGKQLLPILLICLNIPFIIMAWRNIGKAFVTHLVIANIFFAVSLALIQTYFPYTFKGDTIEVVVVGGVILGIGLGLIIRNGGCIDGTEILGIIIHKRTGITVGQVVMACNILVFAAAGIILKDWHPALLSMITYFVVMKTMDGVIVGLDETKSVLIVSTQSKAISQAIMHELGLGLTIMYGRGGFSGVEKEIIYVICERLQLADMKALVMRIDPNAFMAIENLHEVATGSAEQKWQHATKMKKISSTLFGKKHY